MALVWRLNSPVTLWRSGTGAPPHYLGVLAALLFAGSGNVARMQAEPVVFSEIMLAPAEGQVAWIELFNQTATPLDIAEWRLEARDLEFRFPNFSSSQPDRTFLKPFERILLSGLNPAALRLQLGIEEGIRAYGPWSGSIGDRSDRLTLRDKNGVVVVRCDYRAGGVWPMRHLGTGHSLVLKDGDGRINEGTHWQASSAIGGTPGGQEIPIQGVKVTLPAADQFTSETLFDYDAIWRFDDRGRELSTAWRQVEYDDTRWREGPGLFGFEDYPLPEPGLQTRLRTGQMAYYFRKTFQFEGDSEGLQLAVDQVLDDGAVYYLNGRRVGKVRMRASIPAQSVMATETVSNAIEERRVVIISSELLRQGENIVAVQVNQATRQSSDLVFGCRLSLLRPVQPTMRITRIQPDPDGYFEISNLLSETQELEGTMVRLFGDHVSSTLLSERYTLPADGRLRIKIADLEPVAGRLQKVMLSQGDLSEDLAEAVVSSRAVGLVQVRDREVPSRWYLQPQSIEAIDPRLPRPGEIGVSLTEVVLEGERSWIELYNEGEAEVTPGMLVVYANGPNTPEIPIGELIPSGARFVLPIPDNRSGKRWRVDLKNELGESLAVHEFKLRDGRVHFVRDRGGFNEWFVGGEATPGKPNAEKVNIPIVINELMLDPPYGSAITEYVELYNYGEASVDLTGARFTEGIEFEFPAGSVVGAREYVVLAENRSALELAHPAVSVVGEYQGRLSNDGERVRLESRMGNLIDEVSYQVEGDWPKRAAGRGSSLELSHPLATNSYSSAWRDSNETRKGLFRRYEFRGSYREAVRMGRPSDYRELHFYLVGESHLVLKNISLRHSESGKELIRSAPRLSGDAYGDDSGWLIQGNHADSFVDGDRLHLVAHGHGDNRANRAEIDVLDLEPGAEYILSFEARWVSGSPRLIAHTWDNSFAQSFLIDVPNNLGTPGAVNSAQVSAAPPQLEFLRHDPAVPKPGENVTVNVDALNDSILDIELRYRTVAEGVENDWQTRTMSRRGKAGGATLVGWHAQLPSNYEEGTVVEFFVRARGKNGSTCYLPREGENAPALLVVDGRELPSDLRLLRFVVNPNDLRHMQGWGGDRADKYPRLSNQYFNATFVSNESEIRYGASLRRSGSPFTRNSGVSRGKWKLPKDREFRSYGKFSFDDDAERWARHHNRFARYLLYLLGHAACQNEFVRVVINSESVMLREDVEPVDGDFLDRNFKDGNQGELYRIDDQWWFTDDWRQAHQNATWDFVGSKNPSWYRNAWMKRSREEDDDYTRLIDFFERISSGSYSRAEMNRWIDVGMVMRITAVMGYIGDWDSFTQRRGKNAYFYRRAEDGLFQFLQWDADLAFQRENYSFYGGSRSFVAWVRRPENLLQLKLAVGQVHDFCFENPDRVNAWMAEEREAHPDTRINEDLYRNWFRRQDHRVESFLAND